MRSLLGLQMLGNAVLFGFGAVQHAGVAVGVLKEPRVIPAVVVEGLCALAS